MVTGIPDHAATKSESIHLPSCNKTRQHLLLSTFHLPHLIHGCRGCHGVIELDAMPVTILPVAMRACTNRCDRFSMQTSPPRRRGVHCKASPKAPRVAQTVARKVQVQPQSDFANTPNRRYFLPVGDPFPLGPLLYRKTISKQARFSFFSCCISKVACKLWSDCVVFFCTARPLLRPYRLRITTLCRL